MKKSKATRGKKVGVAKGYGPRHAENAKEGDLTQVSTDTVPAMLTPREAVLNRNAAELAGRDEIEALNRKGNELAKRGVDLAQGGDPDIQAARGGQVLTPDQVAAVQLLLSGKVTDAGELEALRRRMQGTGALDYRNAPSAQELPNPNRYQDGSKEVPFDPGAWADPGPLPSPTPDPNVYVNQYPSSFQNVQPPIQENPFYANQLQLENKLGWDPSKPTFGPHSGEPTRRGIDISLNALGNATGIPGLGFLAGKLGRGLWHLIQNMQANGASNEEIGQAVAQVRAQGGASGGGRGDKWHDIFGPRSSASGIPGVGVGIGPTGAPAVGREWWSPDFGRWDLGASGMGAGGYNLAGPGGGFGQRGTGFGSGTVGNFYTAIGLDRLGAGSGPSNLSWGRIGMEGQDRPHFNPYFGGGSGGRLAGGPSVALRQKGDKDVKKEEKPKKYQGGSNYVGGAQPGKKQPNYMPPGVPPAQLPGYGGPPEQIGGMPGPTPPLWWQHKRNMAQGGPSLDWQHKRNLAIAHGHDQPAMPPGRAVLGEPPGYESPIGRLPNRPGYGGFFGPPSGGPQPGGGWGNPGGQPYGEPPGAYYAHPGGGFYPPGGGFKPPKGPWATPLQGGTDEVQTIGEPPKGEEAYGPPVQLSAPQLDLLKQAAKEQGLNASQIAGIAKAFSSGGGGGMTTYGEGSATSQALGPALEAAFPSGYQGGISEVGYAPFVAPGAEFHGDKGGWQGRYDPMYMIPVYQRGTSMVGGYWT